MSSQSALVADFQHAHERVELAAAPAAWHTHRDVRFGGRPVPLDPIAAHHHPDIQRAVIGQGRVGEITIDGRERQIGILRPRVNRDAGIVLLTGLAARLLKEAVFFVLGFFGFNFGKY